MLYVDREIEKIWIWYRRAHKICTFYMP